MVSRIVNRYVEDVEKELPFWVRRKAGKELKDVIYEMMEDYTEGERPVGRDARAVLRELGTPDEIAAQFYEQRKKQKKRMRVSTRKLLMILIRGFSAAAAVLIFTGVIFLAAGITNNMFMIFIGAFMAVLVVFIRMFLPLPENQVPEARRVRR